MENSTVRYTVPHYTDPQCGSSWSQWNGHTANLSYVTSLLLHVTVKASTWTCHSGLITTVRSKLVTVVLQSTTWL